jgi:hypothetical protein
VEFDLMINSSIVAYTFIVSKYTEATGLREYIVALNNYKLYVKLMQAGGTTLIGRYVPMILNQPYRVKITYDGLKDVGGLKIYLNGVETVGTTQGTTITGMINTTSPFIVGKASTYNSIDGYIRNLKIRKAGQLIFFAPLQDVNAVSKDVIGGLVHNAGVLPTVVNKLENERWAYFDGVSSYCNIGTTSTLGWMNSGIFNMEFEYSMQSSILGRMINWGYGVLNRGFMFNLGTTTLRLFISNGSGVYAVNNLTLVNHIIGTHHKVVLKGDGIKLYFTSYNENGSVNTTNEPAGVDCTYVPFATHQIVLSIGTALAEISNFKLKNFKIFTDTAGTIPFMSLSMQNAEDLMIDRITGLQGTATAISIINNNENVLRSKDLWSYFDGLTSYGSIGNTSTLGWMNSGVFRIECEIIVLSNETSNRVIIDTAFSNGHRGFKIYPFTNTIQLRWAISSDTIDITTDKVLGQKYKFIIRGDGSKIYYTSYNEDGSINKTNEPSGQSIAFVPAATTTYLLNIASVNNTTSGYYNFECKVKNLKIYQSTDISIPFMYLSLQDGGNIMKDVWGGLQGTTNNVKVVEL